LRSDPPGKSLAQRPIGLDIEVPQRWPIHRAAPVPGAGAGMIETIGI